MKQEQVRRYQEQYPPGTRIRLEHMGDDPHPIPDGTYGTVQHVDDVGTIHCIFDNGRMLGIIPGEDVFSVCESEQISSEELNMSM